MWELVDVDDTLAHALNVIHYSYLSSPIEIIPEPLYSLPRE